MSGRPAAFLPSQGVSYRADLVRTGHDAEAGTQDQEEEKEGRATGLNILIAAQTIPGSVHDLSEVMPALSAFYIVIAGLLGIIGWFLVRDRSGIKETLDRLVVAVEALRLDLAENYAKRIELEKLSHKVDRHIEHGIIRREQERRAIEDAEA